MVTVCLAQKRTRYAATEEIRPDGSMASILDPVTELVDRYADPTRFEAILFDARGVGACGVLRQSSHRLVAESGLLQQI